MERPLADAAPVDSSTQTFVWVKDSKHGYVKGEFQGVKDGKNVFLLGDGAIVPVAEADVEFANARRFDGVADCSDLAHMNCATVLHNVRARYAQDMIHTYAGPSLLVVNPHKRLPIYTHEATRFYEGKSRTQVPPHVFAVADEAYRAMLKRQRDQSILITGESGAGKSESAKTALQYLATIAGKASQGGKLEEQLLQSISLLEAFGNAKTPKNDNSSRFSSFVRLQFNAGGALCGASIEAYLVDKSRVVHQDRGERSFHIFYQMLAGADSALRHKYFLDTATTFGYLSDPAASLHESDGAQWARTLKAMEVIGLDPDEQDRILRIVAGIMHCGNIEYAPRNGGDGVAIENLHVAALVCTLWGIKDDAFFFDSLIGPRIQAGREVIRMTLNKERALYLRDAMCKAIYDRCFLWIVKKLNHVLRTDRQVNFIGVLDMAGFETLESNSLEQFCINYANERLQQLYNNHTFICEQEEYAREQISWAHIDFGLDSQPTLDLLDRRDQSILCMLDEETIFPRATDESLIQKLHTLVLRYPQYGKPQCGGLHFRVAHYAGDVLYNVKDWLAKNKDALFNDVTQALSGSTCPIVATLFVDPDLNPSQQRSSQRPGPTFRAYCTVALTHKDRLDALMSTLRATEPHYIRCLTPNRQREPHLFDGQLVLEQLACNGVLEGMRIACKGYPDRLEFAHFVKRYFPLHPTLKPHAVAFKEGTELIMTHLQRHLEDQGRYPNPLWQCGATKIFLRYTMRDELEQMRGRALFSCVAIIQAAARGWMSRSARSRLERDPH